MMRLGTSELYFHDVTPIDGIIRQIDGVQQDDILAIANELLREDRLSKVVIHPDAKTHTPTNSESEIAPANTGRVA
jgi:predicted Zn-dependent peptidase